MSKYTSLSDSELISLIQAQPGIRALELARQLNRSVRYIYHRIGSLKTTGLIRSEGDCLFVWDAERYDTEESLRRLYATTDLPIEEYERRLMAVLRRAEDTPAPRNPGVRARL